VGWLEFADDDDRGDFFIAFSANFYPAFLLTISFFTGKAGFPLYFADLIKK